MPDDPKPEQEPEMAGTIIRLANGEYAIRGDDGRIYFIAPEEGINPPREEKPS